MCDPRHFRSKAFDMIFFLLQQALWDKEGHIDILMTRFFNLAVKFVANILPNFKAVRLNDHTASHA